MSAQVLCQSKGETSGNERFICLQESESGVCGFKGAGGDTSAFNDFNMARGVKGDGGDGRGGVGGSGAFCGHGRPSTLNGGGF